MTAEAFWAALAGGGLRPAEDPHRCQTCGAPDTDHHARHPFRRWTPPPSRQESP